MGNTPHRRRRPWLTAVAVVLATAFLPSLPATASPAAPLATAPPKSACGPLDVAFVVDDTGSMGGAIANLQAGITSIVNDVVTNSGGDYQFGMVTFKDNVHVLTDLAPGNQAAITADVAGLAASGGGNEPEASDEAVNTAVNNLAATPPRPQTGNFSGVWRSNATKMVVLITDAHPGGFDDTFTPADTAAAHARALEAQGKGIKLSPVYVPTNPSITDIAPIMQDYATVSGGVYTQSAANGSGVATAIQQSLKDCKRTDVFIRDHVADVGVEPHGLNPIWTSPDLTVCNSPAPCAGTNPAVGGTSYVTVRLNNPGPNGSGTATGSVKLYYTAQGGAALWPNDWTPIGTSAAVTVPAGVSSVTIPWAGVPGPGHFCLLARWISATDPMTFPEAPGSNTLTNTRNNNNIAWRNVDTVKIRPNVPSTEPFTLGNPTAAALTTDLVFGQPGKPFIGGPGKVTIDLGPVLAERWRASGQAGVGVRPVGQTQVEILDPKQARISGLLIQPKERIETALTFLAGDAAAGPFVVQVFQTDKQDADLGGVEFQLGTE